MELFYTDKEKIFECKLKVDGASIKDTSVRMFLQFDDSNVNYMFNGKINENGKTTFKIPTLLETPNTKGKLVIEVIAESTQFQPFEDDFEIKQSKKVTFEKVENNEEVLINENVKKISVKMEKEEPIPVKKVNKDEVLVENFIKYCKNNQGEIKKYREYISESTETIDKANKLIENKLLTNIFMHYIDNEI